MRFKLSYFFPLGCILILTSCGGGGGTTTTSTRDTSAFPVSLAVSAPTDMEAISASQAAAPSALSARVAAAPITYTSTLQRINALLDGSTPLRNVFTPDLLYRMVSNAGCYGPELLYQNHPDAAGSGTLPTGDLGIWQETDSTTGHACVAAQLNSRMKGIRDRSMASLMVLASMIDRLYASGGTLPSSGSSVNLTANMTALGIPDVTFNSMILGKDGSGKWTYDVDFSYSRSGTPYTVKMQVTHNPSSSTAYNGAIKYQIQDSFTGGNCPSNSVTRQGSLVYERVSTDEMRVEVREADFCGHGSMTNSYLADGKLDPNDKYDVVTNTDGWANNFNQLGAEYKLSNLSGKYAYTWQAGFGDSHSRVFNMTVNDLDPLDGEAWFGFGVPVNTASGLGTVGQITGMICNWAGPGNSHVEKEYAQRQFFRYNSSTGKVDVAAGGSDITYAPTNACTYDGSGTFQYDRNLSRALDASTVDVATVKVGASGASQLEFDLFPAAGTLYAGMTIEAAIAARGYTAPSTPLSPLP